MQGIKESSQPLLEISLLGRFRVKIDGIPVAEKRWARRSAKSLIKLLALKPFHALHREQIMDLLWTEESPETALNNLNKAIHAARRAFEPDLAKGSHSRFILTEKNQIILDSPGSLRVDLDEFERLANYALRNNDLEIGQKALEMYRGDLLIEDIYEDWIYTRRESMRILFRKTATKVAGLYAAENNHQASIEILKKLVADDASDEYVHRLLMRDYAETGSKYQALKQFEQCRAALHALGIEPETETVKLGQSIKRGEIIPLKNGYKPAPAETTAPIISTPRIKQLTFQSGVIKSANFLPDGETIVLSADWNGDNAGLYTMRLETGETHRLEIKDAEVYSVCSAGELAVALNPKPEAYLSRAILAKLSLADGISTELLKDVQCADWHPSKNVESSLSDEQFLAIVRDRNGKSCLEFPIGNIIFETTGWISHPRFSPAGKKIAFIEHPLNYDDRGYVVLLDLDVKENKRILTDKSVSILGLAWLNDEIWFTVSYQGSARMIKAVNLKGEERPVFRGTGSLTLQDISGRGEVLVTDNKMRVQTVVCRASEGIERDFSWHDWTLARDLTDDGETLLFEEAGVSGGSELSAYIRKTDGSSVKKIGDGSALRLSPDGKYALLRFLSPHQHLALVPLGKGEIKILENDPENPLIYQVFAAFFPDGERIIFSANDINGSNNLYIQNIDGGKPNIFAPELKFKMLFSYSISPDGRFVILSDSDGKLLLYQISDGTSSPLKNLEKDFWLIRWADDGENLFIRRHEGIPAIVYKYNIASGKKEEWLKLSPKDPTGVYQITSIKLTPDGKTYACSYLRESSDLFLMEDLG